MTNHKVYSAIIQAVKSGQLKEPFDLDAFCRACSNLGEGTYNAFLYKHRKGNQAGKQNYLNWLRRANSVYYVHFVMTYDDEVNFKGKWVRLAKQ